LAATLAATVVLGFGVALARAERGRRSVRERRVRDRRFGLLAEERAGEGLQRITLAQLDIAIEALQLDDRPPEQRVHEVRKALKRLQALLRLLRAELGEASYERESAVLRSVAKRLAQARDAQVLLNTLEQLLERNPKKLGARRGVQRLRAQLQIERDGTAELALADSLARGGARDQLRAMRARVSEWQLSDLAELDAIEPALLELYRKGRRRMQRARRAKHGAEARRLHEWRKRVKDLRYAAELLQRELDRGGKPASERIAGKSGKRAGKRRRARRQAAFIGKLARRADQLGELLGDEHDLAMLAVRVRRDAKRGRDPGKAGARSRKALLKAIAKRRRKLLRRALRDGGRLYGRPPKKFLRRLRRARTLQEPLSRR
jgi:CHAD domain-containing protein